MYLRSVFTWNTFPAVPLHCNKQSPVAIRKRQISTIHYYMVDNNATEANHRL